MAPFVATPFRFWLGVAAFAVLGMFGSVALHDLASKLNYIAEDRKPVTEWIIVHDLRVPDFRVGENPYVSFHRVVTSTLFGGWGVEAHDEAGAQHCAITSGRGSGAVYSPSEKTRTLIPFKAYTGGCALPPGRYRLTVSIRLSAGRTGVVKTISFQSNWFNVTKAGDGD